MPKYRSGKINEEALVSTQACIITRQKLKFWNSCIWILVSSPFSTPMQGRKMLWAAWTEMNHSLLSAVFPDGVGSCQHHLSEHFWRASVLRLCVQNRTALSTPCSPQARSSSIQRTWTSWNTFIFLVYYGLLSFPHMYGAAEKMFLLFPLYLLTSISTFYPMRHFFFICLIHCLGWHTLFILSHSLSLLPSLLPSFSILLSLSSPLLPTELLHLTDSIYIPRNHPAGSREDKTIAEIEMKKEPSIFFLLVKRVTEDQLPISTTISLLIKEIKLSTLFVQLWVDIWVSLRIPRSNTHKL